MLRAQVCTGAALAAVVVTTMAACGDERQPADDSTQGEQQGARQSSSSQSSMQSSSSSASQSSSQVQSSSGDGNLSSFSGSGRTRIAFQVDEESRLAWTNTEGSRFAVDSETPPISIDSTKGTGEAILRPGSYEDVQVRGDAWTIVVRPR